MYKNITFRSFWLSYLIGVMTLLLAMCAPAQGQHTQDHERVARLIQKIDSTLAPLERDLRDRWRELYDSLIVVEQGATQEMRQRIVTRRVLASNQHQQMTQLRSQSNNLRRLLTELRDDLDVTQGTDVELQLQILALQGQIEQLEAAIEQLDGEVAHLMGQNESLLEQLASQPTQSDTLFQPVYRSTWVSLGEPKNREWLDYIVVRPIGWSTGTVKVTGSQYPWWGDLEFRISSGDIWGEGDYFMYANIPVKDWTYTEARLDSFIQVDHRARTGVHLRQSYAPGSKFIQIVYQNGRACMSYREEAIVQGGGCVDATLPLVFQSSYSEGEFTGRVQTVTGSLYEDTELLHEWVMPFEFDQWFYSGIAVTSWRADLVSQANYKWLDITDNHPWFGECRDESNNIIDCE